MGNDALHSLAREIELIPLGNDLSIFSRELNQEPMVELARRRIAAAAQHEESALVRYAAALEELLPFDLEAPPNPLVKSGNAILGHQNGVTGEVPARYRSLVAEYAVAMMALMGVLVRRSMETKQYHGLASALVLPSRMVTKLKALAAQPKFGLHNVTLRLATARISSQWIQMLDQREAHLRAELRLASFNEMAQAGTKHPLTRAYGEWLLWMHDFLPLAGQIDVCKERAKMLRKSFLQRLYQYANEKLRETGPESKQMAILAANALLQQEVVDEEELHLLEQRVFEKHRINLKVLVEAPSESVIEAVFQVMTETIPLADLRKTLDSMATAYENTMRHNFDYEAEQYKLLLQGWKPSILERSDTPLEDKSSVPADKEWTVAGTLVALVRLLALPEGQRPAGEYEAARELILSRLREAGIPKRDIKDIQDGPLVATFEEVLQKAGINRRTLTPLGTREPTFTQKLQEGFSRFTSTVFRNDSAPPSQQQQRRPDYVPLESIESTSFEEWRNLVQQGRQPSVQAWITSGRRPQEWATWPPKDQIGPGRAGRWLSVYSDEDWFQLGVRERDLKAWGVTAMEVFEFCTHRWNGPRARRLFNLSDDLSLFGHTK